MGPTPFFNTRTGCHQEPDTGEFHPLKKTQSMAEISTEGLQILGANLKGVQSKRTGWVKK